MKRAALIALALAIALSCKEEQAPEPPKEPEIFVDASSLNFGATAQTLHLNVSNKVSGTQLEWNGYTQESWIGYFPQKGIVTTEMDQIQVSVTRTMSAGDYVGVLWIQSNGGTEQVYVYMNIPESPPPPLTDRSTVRGYVFYSSTTIPVSGVTVAIDSATYTSGSSGFYELRDIARGSRTITAVKDGFNSFSRTISVADSVVVLDIETTSSTATTRLHGRVKDRRGVGISASSVVVLNPDLSESRLSGQTDANGDYQIASVPQGTRRVRFKKSAYDSLEAEVFLAQFDTQFDAVLTLSPLSPPTSLHQSDLTLRQMRIGWQAVSSPYSKGVNVYGARSSNPNSYEKINSIPVTDTFYVASFPFYDFYRVRSVNLDDVEGEPSSEIQLDNRLRSQVIIGDLPETFLGYRDIEFFGNKYFLVSSTGFDVFTSLGSRIAQKYFLDETSRQSIGSNPDGLIFSFAGNVSGRIDDLYLVDTSGVIVSTFVTSPREWIIDATWDGTNLWSVSRPPSTLDFTLHSHGTDIRIIQNSHPITHPDFHYDIYPKLTWHDGYFYVPLAFNRIFVLNDRAEVVGVFETSSELAGLTVVGNKLHGLTWGEFPQKIVQFPN